MKNSRFFCVILAASLFFLAAQSCRRDDSPSGSPQLKQVTVFSRHGARVPLASYEADLGRVVGEGKEWPIWPVEGGHLSFRGATLEYMAGESFRADYAKSGFTCTPAEAYFCASPKQRTVETARAFSAGFFDGTEVEVNYKGARDFSDHYLDPEFLPLFDYSTAPSFDWGAFRTEALSEMTQMAASIDLTPNFRFMEGVLDFKNSEYAKSQGITQFRNNVAFSVEKLTGGGDPAEPNITSDCDLSLANRASDAFILQYYEQDDYALKKYALTKDLTYNDFVTLSAVKDAVVDIVFTTPIVSVNVSHNMLVMLKREMLAPGRKLNFICAHDSSIASLLAALRVKPYLLDNTIERRTPIGMKIVIEKWGIGKEDYAKVWLAYYSGEQMRMSNPANLKGDAGRLQRYNLSFEGLDLQPNGYYLYSDLMAHIDKTLALYDETAKGKRPF